MRFLLFSKSHLSQGAAGVFLHAKVYLSKCGDKCNFVNANQNQISVKRYFQKQQNIANRIFIGMVEKISNRKFKLFHRDTLAPFETVTVHGLIIPSLRTDAFDIPSETNLKLAVGRYVLQKLSVK